MTPRPLQETSAADLRLEARAFGRLILRSEVEPEFIERYVEAHNFLFLGTQLPAETALVGLAVRRPMLLGSLDAAAAFLQPGSLLHKKALLMAAILEASPRYAQEFLPRRIGWIGLAVLGVRLGLGTAVNLVVGVPALWWLRRRA